MRTSTISLKLQASKRLPFFFLSDISVRSVMDDQYKRKKKTLFIVHLTGKFTDCEYLLTPSHLISSHIDL